MRLAPIATVALALTLAGCGFSGIGSGGSGLFGGGGLRGSAQDVDGIRFRSRIQAIGENGRAFAVTTAGAGRNLRAAQEAGRLEAVRYCLTRFGGSEIGWQVGPDRPPEQVALGDRGALVLSGLCIHR